MSALCFWVLPMQSNLWKTLEQYRSFQNCRLPSSTRSIAFWAINPTAKRTIDPRLPPPPARTVSGSLLASVRSLLLFQSQVQSVAHVQGKNTMLPPETHLQSHLPLPRRMLSDGCQEMASIRGTSKGSHPSLPPLLTLQEETHPRPWPFTEILDATVQWRRSPLSRQGPRNPCLRRGVCHLPAPLLPESLVVRAGPHLFPWTPGTLFRAGVGSHSSKTLTCPTCSLGHGWD